MNRLLDILPPAPTPTSTPSDSTWQFLNSPFFNTVAVIFFGLFAVAGVIIAIIAYRKGQRRREVSWQVLSDSLVIPNPEVQDRIEIRLNNNPIKDLSLVVLRVWNSGNVAIAQNDYVYAIKLKFEGRKVQDTYISPSDMNPPTLMAKDDIETFREDNKRLRQNEAEVVELPKTHLNSQEASKVLNTYVVKVLLTGTQGSIGVAGGVINEGDIKEVLSLEPPSRINYSALITFLILAAAIGLLIYSIYLAYRLGFIHF